LTAMTDRTTKSMTGQLSTKVPMKSRETVAAIIRASTTCTRKKKAGGRRIVLPESAATIHATIGPISRAAGKPASSSGSVVTIDSAATHNHWKRGGIRPKPAGGSCLSAMERSEEGKNRFRTGVVRFQYRVAGVGNRAKS